MHKYCYVLIKETVYSLWGNEPDWVGGKWLLADRAKGEVHLFI